MVCKINRDQIVNLVRKVTLVLSANCPIYRIARICLPNGLCDLLSTHVSKGRDKMKKKISLPYLCTLWSEPPLFDSFIMVISASRSTRDFNTYLLGTQRRLR